MPQSDSQPVLVPGELAIGVLLPLNSNETKLVGAMLEPVVAVFEERININPEWDHFWNIPSSMLSNI